MAGSGSINPVIGVPGFAAGPTVNYGQIFDRFYQSGDLLPGGGYIASFSQDYLNTGSINTLRPGLLMGQITSGGFAQYWAPSIIDSLQAAISTQAATSLALTPAGAVGLVARIGTSGTFTLTGGVAANGVARSVTVTYSAVNTTTGVVTITAISVNAVQTLGFTNSPSGTFTLEVIDQNGVKQATPQITYSGTAATLVSNINTALNAALGSSQVVASGSAVTAIALTFSGSNYAGLPQSNVIIDTDGLSAGNASVTPTTAAVDGRFVSGSFVGGTDGSQVPTSVIPDGSGILMTGPASGANVQWADVVIAQLLISQNLLPYWPTDTGLKTWIKTSMNAAPGQYGFQFLDTWTAAV